MMGGQHAAPTEERDLAEALALSLVLREHAGRIHYSGQPDMETVARLMNQGWQSAQAWNAADDATLARDDAADVVDEAAENGPDPVLFEEDGKVVAAVLLAPGYAYSGITIVLEHGTTTSIIRRRP